MIRNSLKINNQKKYSLNFDAGEDAICLNTYTSGTMGVPKCVQLRHSILSQQAGLEQIWDLNEKNRFFSDLPWHHSFGDIPPRAYAIESVNLLI